MSFLQTKVRKIRVFLGGFEGKINCENKLLAFFCIEESVTQAKVRGGTLIHKIDHHFHMLKTATERFYGRGDPNLNYEIGQARIGQIF